MPPVSRLLIATTNRGKIREILQILEGSGGGDRIDVTLLTLGDFPSIEPPEETGRTFAENARLKARYYAAATGVPTVAEDSGLEIDALDGAPGVESARFAGADATYPEKFAELYKRLKASGSPNRSARFVAALALADPRAASSTSPGGASSTRSGAEVPVVFEARGTVEGQIANAPRGTGGFGYDPIFFYPPFGCTLAEAGARKSSVSHRGEAFRALRKYLKEHCN
ncbi:MAG TPA: non-canonical purine NTP pyrophosphatase [Vicinamibacterales bacterium]|nr:non-canonical purine NTP pyrophosphatase [Vicinamibacterales bacterium]